jgi:prevent-host-death family protein
VEAGQAVIVPTPPPNPCPVTQLLHDAPADTTGPVSAPHRSWRSPVFDDQGWWPVGVARTLTFVSEMAIPEAREHLADVVHRTAESGSVIYLTDHGRRLAAIVPVGAAARLEQDTADDARQRLAEAGLLATVEGLTNDRPDRDAVTAARSEAGRGRSLSEYVVEGR